MLNEKVFLVANGNELCADGAGGGEHIFITRFSHETLEV